MAYRNGTYVAFHAQGTNLPGKSDMDYYNLMKAWSAKTDDDFTMINSHDKASSVRDSSKKATLRASLQERLRNSKNMVLIIGETTRLDTDWVPFEIEQAIDTYKIRSSRHIPITDRSLSLPSFPHFGLGRWLTASTIGQRELFTFLSRRRRSWMR